MMDIKGHCFLQDLPASEILRMRRAAKMLCLAC